MNVKVKDLRPHPLNIKIYTLSDIDDLSKSIEDVGLLEKIVITRDNVIISGHRRYSAINRLGWKEVEVEVRDFEEKDMGLYVISFNKHRVKTASELLNEIKFLYESYGRNPGRRTDLYPTSNNIDRGCTTQGKISDDLKISEGNISKLLYIDRSNDKMIGLIDKGIMTINQAYLECKRFEKSSLSSPSPLNRIKKINDDCQIFNKSSSNMTEVEDESVQTIFTSPPYWRKRKYHNGSQEIGLENTPDEYVDNLVNHLNDCKRVLNPTGSFFLNLGDTFSKNSLQNIPHKVIIRLCEEGWVLRNTIIWKKTNPKPSSTHTNLTPSYEFIFHLVKTNDYYYQETRVPISEKTKPSLPPRHRNLSGTESKSISPYFPSFDGKNLGDYWDEDIVKTAVYTQRLEGLSDNIEHPAPFPLEIIILPILQTSKEMDIILDPFCGSGNTGIVSLKLGRKFIGYDINADFCKLAKNRLSSCD